LDADRPSAPPDGSQAGSRFRTFKVKVRGVPRGHNGFSKIDNPGPPMEDPVNSPLSFQEGKRSHQSLLARQLPQRRSKNVMTVRHQEARAYDDAQQAEQISRFHREQANETPRRVPSSIGTGALMRAWYEASNQRRLSRSAASPKVRATRATPALLVTHFFWLSSGWSLPRAWGRNNEPAEVLRWLLLHRERARELSRLPAAALPHDFVLSPV